MLEKTVASSSWWQPCSLCHCDWFYTVFTSFLHPSGGIVFTNHQRMKTSWSLCNNGLNNFSSKSLNWVKYKSLGCTVIQFYPWAHFRLFLTHFTRWRFPRRWWSEKVNTEPWFLKKESHCDKSCLGNEKTARWNHGVVSPLKLVYSLGFVIFHRFYKGKAPLNRHLGEYVVVFCKHLEQI